jgi:hypothetical protein
VSCPNHGLCCVKSPKYTCNICSESVSAENSQVYTMWHCLVCYTVCHLNCVKSWAITSADTLVQDARTNRRSWRNLHMWKYPVCPAQVPEPPKWTSCCGSSTYNFGCSPDKPNSRGGICGRVKECVHEDDTLPYTKPCHPGPCNTVCKTTCFVERTP